MQNRNGNSTRPISHRWLAGCAVRFLLVVSPCSFAAGQLVPAAATRPDERTEQATKLKEAAQLTTLTAISADRTTAERHALHALFEEPNLAANVFEVRRRASQLDKDARLRYLLGWVLPGENHPGFRLAGDFTPMDPPPTTNTGQTASTGEQGEARVHLGGELVSPAFDLIDLAQEMQVLDKLRTRIEQVKVDAEDGQQERARNALLYLLDIAGGDEAAAQTHFIRLFDLFRESDHYLAFDRWPETLAISRGVHHPATRAIMAEFLQLQSDMYKSDERGWSTHGWTNQDHHFFSLLGTFKSHEAEQAAGDRSPTAPRLENWVPVSYATSKTRGEGYPRPHWRLGDHRVDKLLGHEFDYLMFRIPLRGNYEVDCDLTPFDWQDTQLMVAGTWAAPHWDRVSYELGTFRESKPRRELKPKLGYAEAFARVRAVVRDGVCTTYYNGRKLHEAPLPAEPEPWLAVRNWARFHGAVRDLRVTGNPIIPEQSNLAAAPDLQGWIPYFEDTVGPTGAWRREADDGIVGMLQSELAGSWKEGLLRYCRPMLEDGTIEFEFYYQPGRADVHPALDRLAFLLEPEGVRVHWTGADPANRFSEPGNRRGPDRLPLRDGAWNQLRLTLRGDTVSLVLNEQFIYERVLEPTNQRTFGLFHYADQTETRVRNIVWRGEWPRALPPSGEQELADTTVDSLDRRAVELTAAFEHDFTREGLPENYFRYFSEDTRKAVSPSADGVAVKLDGAGVWSRAAFGPRLRVSGDFDITASFERLATNPVATCGIHLLAILSSKDKHHCRATRSRHENGYQSIDGELMSVTSDGGRRIGASQQSCEADSGRLRIARRGDTIYFLFAEGDSPVFRVIGKEKATTNDSATDGLRLVAAGGEGSTTNVIWKKMSIRAEQLVFTTDPEPTVLLVMSADGKEIRQLTKPIGDFGDHGSPAWSPDGKQIAFDTYNDSSAESHVFLINADGSEMRDLGFGSMPTFSPDGKRIAFTWAGRGVAIMDVNGENREILDPGGWGAQWSPDGKSIAYNGGNITLLDLATNRKRSVLEGEQATRYGYIYWNMSWSHDSSRICFKGRTSFDGKYEIAIASAAGSSKGFQVLYANELEPQTDFSWYPSGKQILCAMRDPGLRGERLFTLDAEQAGPPKLLPTQPLGLNSTSPDWSPDGKYIVFSSRLPQEWKTRFRSEEAQRQEPAGKRE